MPLDEKEKEALKERYKEHRQAIWSGKRSRNLNSKKKEDIKTKTSTSPREIHPVREVGEVCGETTDYTLSHGVNNRLYILSQTLRPISRGEQPTKSGNLEDATSVEESPKLADYEEQNQMVILRRAKKKKPVNEGPTEKMPSVSERTTWFTSPLPQPPAPFGKGEGVRGLLNPSSLYELESTHKTEAKLSSPDVKTTILERSEPQSNSSSSSPNVAELSTNLEVIADTTTSPENILKEKIKSQRQEIWTGTSSQKKHRPKLKKGKEAEENLGIVSAQNSQETKKGLTIGIVIISIAAVVFAVVLGVLLGYLLA